jgi:Ca2+-transporting ATPase
MRRNMADTEQTAPTVATHWHALSAAEAASRLATNTDRGLTQTDAAQRRHRFGDNALHKQPPRSIASMIVEQLSDFMILVLLAAAVVAGIVGEPKDSVVIIVIVALNAIIGVVQEWRAERALEMLRQMTTPNARVLRDGEQRVISARELVPGDVVLLSEGDIAPADLRLVEAATLRADESMLTGESVAVEKDCDDVVASGAAVGDRTNMVFKGTIITHGRGIGMTVATGMTTELGRIASMLDAAERLRTPLQRRLARFGQWLGLAVLGLCAVVFLFGLLRGEPPLLMFLTAVSLAVAAVPEALPAVVTVALALGAREMMRHNALVRALPAVETLGSVTTICSDKTGTLTQNRMHVEAISSGFEPLAIPQQGAGPDCRVPALLTAMSLCSDANISADGTFIGDPTETALAAFAAAAGYERHTLEERLARIGEIAFDSDRRRMTTLHQDGAGRLACTKGAPESVIPRCTKRLTASGRDEPCDTDAVLEQAQRMAEAGLRVIAYAERRWPDAAIIGDTDATALEEQMTLLGLVGLLDPPRPEVKEAVALCRRAGITPVMITGDHPATARTIARRLGFIDDGDGVISGPQLSDMSPQELAARVSSIRVYARADPAQKIRIVKALQSRHEIVAMTGDGVNDAPALKRADIGVAMGRGGTDVAREAASLVLLDDNFATIVGAVRAGRRIYDNIRKFIKYTMTSNSGEIWTIFLAPFFGLPIPLLPIHILWINLVTDGLPGLALAVEPEEENVMQRPPRPTDESVFARGMWQHIIWCGLLMGLVCIATQAWAIASGRTETWQTMVFTVLTLSQMGHVLAIRSETAPMISARFFGNRTLLGAVALTFTLQIAVIYIPALNALFNTVPLSAAELALCVALSTIVAAMVEIEKWLIRRGLIYRP